MNIRQKCTRVAINNFCYTAVMCVVVLLLYFARVHNSSVAGFDGVYQKCRIHNVTDGDTVNALCNGRLMVLRLIYIDTPEMDQGAWGMEAKVALQSLVDNKDVLALLNGKDVYQRYLATLYVDGVNVNEELVKRGFARVYSRYKPPTGYKNAMKKAKSQRLGIWRIFGLHQDPQRWRRLSQK